MRCFYGPGVFTVQVFLRSRCFSLRLTAAAFLLLSFFLKGKDRNSPSHRVEPAGPHRKVSPHSSGTELTLLTVLTGTKLTLLTVLTGTKLTLLTVLTAQVLS